MKDESQKSQTDAADDSILASIAAVINEMGFECEKTPNGLFVDSGHEGTLVTAEQMDKEVSNGARLKEVIRVTTRVDPLENFYPRELLKLNALAALGAALHDDKDGSLNIVTRLSVYEDSEANREVSVHLLASAAIFNVYSFFGEELDLEFSGSESIWSKPDFSAAAAILKEAGFVASDSSKGMSVEIPVDSEKLPNVPTPHVSLLTFDIREAHPNLGAGLYYKLELPIHFSEGELIELAIRMNEAEFSTVDAPPMIGAWTGILERNSLAYMGFWPNSMYWPGVVSHISEWMIRRNEFACTAIY